MEGTPYRGLPARTVGGLPTGRAGGAGSAGTTGSADTAGTAATAATAAAARVEFHAWTTPGDFAAGSGDGLFAGPGPLPGLVMTRPAGTTMYHDPYLDTAKAYDYSTWTSPVHAPGFAATALVASWNAQTPAGTWLKVELNATMEDGAATGWLDLGHWAGGDTDIRRASVSPVAAPHGQVDTDVFHTYAGHGVHAYRLRVTLYRAAGTVGSPRLWRLGAVTSTIPDRSSVPASRPGPACGAAVELPTACGAAVELPVPAYSQRIHAGQYPQWGGGQAWCSPASIAMVVEYWGARPSQAELAEVDPGYADPSVDVAARGTYDYAYQGTGNWPFNTAYAASYGLDAQVVRLRSLDDVERLVAAGIPVITSQAFDRGEITGADYRTNGHLWVVVGFTASGDVVVNDPASPSDAQVRQVYHRRQFENAWLRTSWTRADGSAGRGSGGVAYLVRPPSKELPPVADPANPSW